MPWLIGQGNPFPTIITTEEGGKPMPELHAQPYNISATGFYFDCVDDFNEKAQNNFDPYGDLVEEYEIQFIDGTDLECTLFKAWDVHQGNLTAYFNALDLDEHDQIAQIAMAECGYTLDENICTDDVELCYEDSLFDLAIRFVEEGLYGEIPKAIEHYIDYNAIAHDLGMEYDEMCIEGQNIIFRCP